MNHHPIARRDLLSASLGLAAAAILPTTPARADSAKPFSGDFFPDPIKLASLELLRTGNIWLVRATSTEGAIGYAICNDRISYLYPILQSRVMPFFLRKDVRDLETLLDGVYTHASNYKLAGIAFWCCVAWVEFAILDMLGKMAKKNVAELLGGVLRKELPIYLSSMRRDTTPQQEVDWLAGRVAQTGARAIKVKIGGRMSRNKDASPGRTEQLVVLARKTFGEKFTIYVDANGSYDADHAIEVGKMLQAHNIAFFEEPCEWDDYDATRKVAQALAMPVAGGEQDSSLTRWQQIIREKVVCIVQPDMTYNGGVLRASRVARWAAEKSMPITPHSPQRSGNEPYILHFAAATKNIGPYIEFDAVLRKPDGWYAPVFEPREGKLVLPEGAGWGITIDPTVLGKSQVVKGG